MIAELSIGFALHILFRALRATRLSAIVASWSSHGGAMGRELKVKEKGKG